MKIAKLPVGKDKLKIKYLGDAYTAPQRRRARRQGRQVTLT